MEDWNLPALKKNGLLVRVLSLLFMMKRVFRSVLSFAPLGRLKARLLSSNRPALGNGCRLWERLSPTKCPRFSCGRSKDRSTSSRPSSFSKSLENKRMARNFCLSGLGRSLGSSGENCVAVYPGKQRLAAGRAATFLRARTQSRGISLERLQKTLGKRRAQPWSFETLRSQGTEAVF